MYHTPQELEAAGLLKSVEAPVPTPFWDKHTVAITIVANAFFGFVYFGLPRVLA